MDFLRTRYDSPPDTHFFHDKVVEYNQRPFANVEEMNEELIARWSSVVHRDSIVFHPRQAHTMPFGASDLAERMPKRWCGPMARRKPTGLRIDGRVRIGWKKIEDFCNHIAESDGKQVTFSSFLS